MDLGVVAAERVAPAVGAGMGRRESVGQAVTRQVPAELREELAVQVEAIRAAPRDLLAKADLAE